MASAPNQSLSNPPPAAAGRERLAVSSSRACALSPRHLGNPVFRDFCATGGNPEGRVWAGPRGRVKLVIGQLEAQVVEPRQTPESGSGVSFIFSFPEQADRSAFAERTQCQSVCWRWDADTSRT